MALSHQGYMLMVQMARTKQTARKSIGGRAPSRQLAPRTRQRHTFLGEFGMPTLLWRVLHFAGYHELPQYRWIEEYVEGQPWYEVRQTIPARTQPPFWQEWKAESEGKTPWEAAQVVAFEMLSQICQQHGDALTGSAASVFPWVDPSTTNWEQRSQNALIRD